MLNECNLKNFMECAIQHCNKNTPDKVFSFRDLVECLRSKFKSTIVEYKQGILRNRKNRKKIGKGAMVYTALSKI